MLLVVGVHHPHRIAFPQLAEQGFWIELGVGANHIVRSPQNGAAGAVVLLQLDHPQAWKVSGQFLKVVQRGATPAINGLVIVAHSGEALAFTGQQFEQFILGGIGVLVFVHQPMADLFLPFRTHFGVVLQQLERQTDQVVEVHALVSAQALFISRHDARSDAFIVILRLCFGHGGIEPHVFPQADGPLPLTGGGRIGGAAGVLEQTGHIIAVQNAELGLESQSRTVLSQDANAQGMKRTDRDLLCGFADELFGPLAHLGRGFVGEGDGGNRAGIDARLNQQCQLVGDHAGFARTCTGQNQARALQNVDGFELGVVQAS